MKYEDLRDGAWYVLVLPFPSGVTPDEHSPSEEAEPGVVIVRANSIGGPPQFRLTHWGKIQDVWEQGNYRVDFDGTIVPTYKEGPGPAPRLTLNNLARIPIRNEDRSRTACPECDCDGAYVNVGRAHFGICEACKVTWPIGSNLFSSWKDENEAVWARNRELLSNYRQVGCA